jgi:hypothetical protein
MDTHVMIKTAQKALLCIAIAIPLAACNTSALQTPGAVNSQGLTTYPTSNFDELAIKSDVDFSRYTKVKFEPISVSYDERRRQYGPQLTDKDFQFSESEQATFNKQFVDAISNNWNKTLGWELTEEIGDDVILVKASVSDLYLYASIKHNLPHQSTSYTNETSRMVISLDLYDSNSGELLLTSEDKKITGESNNTMRPLQKVNSVTYWHDAYNMFQRLASQLSLYIKA